ncbi:uncharacterized protein LOC135195486 [Macrobrachium nipponense]|uniref:uncharacterized protein LOC135195486 n=1 Tax=Macrobrachium nipponense TaxID=159736 RepID=UPI0030C87C01
MPSRTLVSSASRRKSRPTSFTAVWRAGKLLCIPDPHCSRAPVRTTPTRRTRSRVLLPLLIFELSWLVNAVTLSDESPTQDPQNRILQDLRDAAKADPAYTHLLDCVTSGFPRNRYDLHNSLLPYWKLREDLYADGDLVLYGARVVVPAALRRRTLSHLHDSHRGVEATKRRARQSVFWPGIDSDIANTVRACEACQTLQPSQPQEPVMNDDNPTRPLESVSADFFVVAGKSFSSSSIACQDGLLSHPAEAILPLLILSGSSAAISVKLVSPFA